MDYQTLANDAQRLHEAEYNDCTVISTAAAFGIDYAAARDIMAKGCDRKPRKGPSYKAWFWFWACVSHNTDGAMVQTYIIRSDVHPIEAVKTGQDASICGTCQHRGDGTGKGRSCYVTLAHGPRSVYDKYTRGGYPRASASIAIKALGEGRAVRLGTYGDPAAVPAAVWECLVAGADSHTGYTHQHENPALSAEQRRRIASLCMLSADTAQQADAYNAQGFRTFRVSADSIKRRGGQKAHVRDVQGM